MAGAAAAGSWSASSVPLTATAGSRGGHQRRGRVLRLLAALRGGLVPRHLLAVGVGLHGGEQHLGALLGGQRADLHGEALELSGRHLLPVVRRPDHLERCLGDGSAPAATSTGSGSAARTTSGPPEPAIGSVQEPT